MRERLPWVLAVIVVACSSPGPATVTPPPSSPSPTAAVAATASPGPPALATASATTRPSPTPITDPAHAFRPLVNSWRPSGLTLLFATADANETTLMALTVGGAGRVDSLIRILSFGSGHGQWSLRGDGGAVAVSAWTGRGTRIAVWDIRSGAARWVTADEAGTNDFSPVWSRDGSLIYYGSSSDDGRTAGLFQIGVDGLGKRQIPASERVGQPSGLTPDGNGLIWSRGQAGGSVEILDLRTGVNWHVEDNAGVASWRAKQPRLLLRVGGCCAGRPGGSLVAFDDVAKTSRVVAERSQYGETAWGAGAWDPTGTRIAAVRYDDSAPYDGSLVILDPEAGTTQTVPGILGVGQIRWLPEGLVFSLARARQAGSELMFLPDVDRPAVSLYKDAAYLQLIDVVRP